MDGYVNCLSLSLCVSIVLWLIFLARGRGYARVLRGPDFKIGDLTFVGLSIGLRSKSKGEPGFAGGIIVGLITKTTAESTTPPSN